MASALPRISSFYKSSEIFEDLLGFTLFFRLENVFIHSNENNKFFIFLVAPFALNKQILLRALFPEILFWAKIPDGILNLGLDLNLKFILGDVY